MFHRSIPLQQTKTKGKSTQGEKEAKIESNLANNNKKKSGRFFYLVGVIACGSLL